MTSRPRSNWIGDMIKHLLACLISISFALQLSQSAPAIEDEDQGGCYYMFNHYGEGDRILTNEPCLNCTCHNSMLMCYLRVCPFTRPIGQDCTIEKKADQCCPVITCPEVPVSLLTSTPSLISSSTTTPSSASNTAVAQAQRGCEMGDKYYSDGAQVDLDLQKPCELCYCIRNRTACVMQECILHVEGCEPQFEAGVCCPVRYQCQLQIGAEATTTTLTGLVASTVSSLFLSTPTPHPGGCYRDGDFYHDGSQIPTPGEAPCEHCYCMRGEIVCAVQECGSPLEGEGQNCTAIPPRTGLCCPEKYACQTSSLEPNTSVSQVILPVTDISVLTSTQGFNTTDAGYTKGTTEIPDNGVTTRRYEEAVNQSVKEVSIAGESSTGIPEKDTTVYLISSSSSSLHDEEQLLENEIESKQTTVREMSQGVTQSVGGTRVETESDKASSLYGEATTMHLDVLTDRPKNESGTDIEPESSGIATTDQILPETTMSSLYIQSQSQFDSHKPQKPSGTEAESTAASFSTSSTEPTVAEKKADDEQKTEVGVAFTVAPQSGELNEIDTEGMKEAPWRLTTSSYDSDMKASTEEPGSLSTETVEVEPVHDVHIGSTSVSNATPALSSPEGSEMSTTSGMEASLSAEPGLVPSPTSSAGILHLFNTSKFAAMETTVSATSKEQVGSETSKSDGSMATSSYEENSTVHPPQPMRSSTYAAAETNISVEELPVSTPASVFRNQTFAVDKFQSPAESQAPVTEHILEETNDSESENTILTTSNLTGDKEGFTQQIAFQTSTESFLHAAEHLEVSADEQIKENLVTITEGPSSTESSAYLEPSPTVPVFSVGREPSDSPGEMTKDGIAVTLASTTQRSATLSQKPYQPQGGLGIEPIGSEPVISVKDSSLSTLKDSPDVSKPTTTNDLNLSGEDIRVSTSPPEASVETTELPFMDRTASPATSGEETLRQTTSSIDDTVIPSTMADRPLNKTIPVLIPTETSGSSGVPGELIITELPIIPEKSITTLEPEVTSKPSTVQVPELTTEYPTESELQVSLHSSNATESPTKVPGAFQHELETVQADEEEHITEKVSPAPELISHDHAGDSQVTTAPSQTTTKVSILEADEILNTSSTPVPSTESSSQRPTESEQDVGTHKELMTSIPGSESFSTHARPGPRPDEPGTTEVTVELKPIAGILPVFSTESSKTPLDETFSEVGNKTVTEQMPPESITIRNVSSTPPQEIEQHDSSEATLSQSTLYPTSNAQEHQDTTSPFNVSTYPGSGTTESSKKPDQSLNGFTQSSYSSTAISLATESSKGSEFHESTANRSTSEEEVTPKTSVAPVLQVSLEKVEPGDQAKPMGTQQSTLESITEAIAVSTTPPTSGSVKPDGTAVTIEGATQISLAEHEVLSTTSDILQEQITSTEESRLPVMKPANLMSAQSQSLPSREQDEGVSSTAGLVTTLDLTLRPSTETYSDGIASFPASSNEEPLSTTHAQNYPRIPGEGSCFVEGVTYPNGSRIPPSTSCQIACACQNSIVHCLLVHCPAPPRGFGECKPVYTQNKCCPKYNCDETMDHSVTVTPESSQTVGTASFVTVTSGAFLSDELSSNLTIGEHKVEEKLQSTHNENLSSTESIKSEITTAIPQSDEVHSPSLASADHTIQSSSTESVTIRNPAEGSTDITEKLVSSSGSIVVTYPIDLAGTETPSKVEHGTSSTPAMTVTNASAGSSPAGASETGTTLKYPVTFSTTSTTASPASWPFPTSSVSPSAPSNGACLFDARVYMSAQQIPRDDPCDFCFCFRGDIICLQQSCPPPIPGCYEEPIPGFCCPRYECPVGNGNSTAAPLFPPSYYHNQVAQSNSSQSPAPPSLSGSGHGCEIQGEYYDAGQLVTDTSGPCLECRCGQAGIMECDPRECQPEPMLRKMIEAITSR